MQNTMWNIKIISSPFRSNVEIAGELVMKLHVPYSKDMVSIEVNPDIIEYQDDQRQNIRQVTVSKDIKETKVFQFDFKNNNIHKMEINNKNYEIKLMNIGTVSEQGQDFPVFELLVKQI